jgi:hypothetical protein
VVQAEKLHALVYMEGFRIPVSSIVVNSGINIHTSLSMYVVPTEMARKILPRTRINAFWLDNCQSNPNYVVVFEGETIGYGLARQFDNRSTIIHAVGYTEYWDNCKKYYVDFSKGLAGAAEKIQIQSKKGGDADTSPGIVPQEKGYFAKIFREADKKEFLDIVIDDLINKIGKTYDIYNIANERYQIDKRITSATSGVVSKLIRADYANVWVEQISGQESGQRGITETIIHLLGIIHHHFVSLAVPSKLTEDITTYNHDIKGKKEKYRIGNVLFKPNCYMMPAPRCNVIFPNEYTSYQYSRNHLSEITRIRFTPLPSMLLEAAVSSGIAKAYYYPESLAEDFVRLSKDPNQKETVRDFNPHLMTFEERMKGIIPSFTNQGWCMSQFLRAPENSGEANLATYARENVKYKYYQSQFATRQFSIQITANVHIVPGFPCVLIDGSDQNAHIIADVVSVSTSINAAGGGDTSIVLASPREYDEIDFGSIELDHENMKLKKDLFFDANKKTFVGDGLRRKEPSIPAWFEESWGTFQDKVKESVSSSSDKLWQLELEIGANTFSNINANYKKLLGTNGGEAITSWETKRNPYSTIKTAIDIIKNDYEKWKAQGRLEDNINRFRRRNLVSADEAFAYVGAESKFKFPVSQINIPEIFSGKTGTTGFDKTYDDIDKKVLELKKAIVKEFKNELNAKQGFKG